MAEDNDTSLQRLEYDAALRMHNGIIDLGHKTLDAAVQSELAAVRTLFLLNGGALVALLAFLSSLASTPSFGDRVALFASSLETFAWAVTLAALAFGGIFGANMSNFFQLEATEKTWQYPYALSTITSDRWHVATYFFQGVTVTSMIGSLALFVTGFLQIKDAVVAFQVLAH